MLVLIVEDDENRMAVFRGNLFVRDAITWAPTAADGIRLLKLHKYDLVMLDHDLADAHYMNIELTAESAAAYELEDTGQDVARFIATMDDPPPFVFVHSWNPTGALAMESTLKGAGISTFRSPFGSADLKRGIIQYREAFNKLAGIDC